MPDTIAKREQSMLFETVDHPEIVVLLPYVNGTVKHRLKL
jgi:hypothetical protein